MAQFDSELKTASRINLNEFVLPILISYHIGKIGIFANIIITIILSKTERDSGTITLL